MTTKINNYNNIKDTRITAEIWRCSTGENCGQISIDVAGEFSVNLIDDPSNIDLFCKKHNISLIEDQRTGVERYLDRLEVTA